MSKIEVGRIAVQISTVDLHALVKHLDDMFQLAAASKRIRLEVEGLARLPRFVQVDDAKLRQILMNMLGNAVKFTANGGVTRASIWMSRAQVSSWWPR